ncbi:MAG TPA: glycosyltransferase [Gemmatimonadales bacterium]|nr:glycosyltransferase [Gemmatimonadales bacterium]
MDDIRWFAPNRFCTLVVPRLQERGLAVALEGDRPARLAIAMDAQVAAAAYDYAARRRAALIHYVWDLPPWRLGRGRHDWVWYALGRYWRLPRLGRRYAARRGYYSRLRFVARHAREVWVPSAGTAASVRAHFGLTARRVPFCYDSERFTPAPAPRARAPSAVLLSISRLTPSKNQAAVIRAAARFTPKLAVRLIGEGPSRAELERLASGLGVACSIEGGLSDDAVVAAYRTADVVVCPSRFEGFGLTPLEAIACGAPVVASDIPPHREFLGGVPHFFAPDDAAGLVAAIAAARSGPPPSPDAVRELTIAAAARRFADALAAHLR